MTTDVYIITLRDAARCRAEVEAVYRDAVYCAHLAGASFSELATELGVSRQAVRQMVARCTAGEVTMRKRVETIDAAYDAAIESVMDKPGVFKRVTAYQNGVSKKLGRKGLAYKPVSVQMRDYAEDMLLRCIEDFPDDVRVQRIAGCLNEAAALRKRLAAFDDARLGF